MNDTFEIARKISEKYNTRYPEKVRNIVAWQEYLKSLGLPFEIDHSESYTRFIFIHDKDAPETKSKKIEARKKYLLSGAFLAATMTDAIIVPENGAQRVLAKHQGITIDYQKTQDQEKFSASGLQGKLDDATAQENERYLNNALLENIKTAFLLVQNAKLAGFESITFGNTTDPCRRYALKLACDALGVDCSGEKIDVSALPQFKCLNIPVAKRMQELGEEYLNFPYDPPKFDGFKKEEIKVEIEKTDNPKARRLLLRGLHMDYGSVHIDLNKMSPEQAEKIADEANNPLIKSFLKSPDFKILSYTRTNPAEIELTLGAEKDWDTVGESKHPGQKPKSFAESFRAGLETKLKLTALKVSAPKDSLFEKESALAYAIERHSVQEAVRGHGGFLQFRSYIPDTKEVIIDLSGACNDTCGLSQNTKGNVQTTLLSSFPTDVKKVEFKDIPTPRI